MKIGLTGPSGSGKTTLAKELSRKYNLQFVSNVARSSPGAQFNMLTSNANLQNQLIIINTLKFWAEQDNIVSDRIVADAYVYLKMSSADLDLVVNNFVLKQLYDNFNDYDLIIYCPWYGWDVEAEGVRNLNGAYQQQFSRKLECVLFDYCSTNLLIMEDEPVEQRLLSVQDFLD